MSSCSGWGHRSLRHCVRVCRATRRHAPRRHHHPGARHVLPPSLFSTFHADARGLSGSWVPPRFGAPPRSGVRRDLGPP